MMAFNRRQLREQGERDLGNGGSSHSAHQDTSQYLREYWQSTGKTFDVELKNEKAHLSVYGKLKILNAIVENKIQSKSFAQNHSEMIRNCFLYRNSVSDQNKFWQLFLKKFDGVHCAGLVPNTAGSVKGGQPRSDSVVCSALQQVRSSGHQHSLSHCDNMKNTHNKYTRMKSHTMMFH